MELAATVLHVLVVLVLVAVFCAIALAAATVLCITLFALAKPPLAGLIDAWMDWLERRMGC